MSTPIRTVTRIPTIGLSKPILSFKHQDWSPSYASWIRLLKQQRPPIVWLKETHGHWLEPSPAAGER